MKSKKIEKPTRSNEVLAHFHCSLCFKWWTIGDAPARRKKWWCPWCGAAVVCDTK